MENKEIKKTVYGVGAEEKECSFPEWSYPETRMLYDNVWNPS